MKVSDIVRRYRTPLYIYSLKTQVHHFEVTSRAFRDIPHLICYAAKANSNIAFLKTAALYGAGADVVSGGELQLALKAGIRGERIVFSGVGKEDSEIELALKSGILFICAESLPELERIEAVARKLKIPAPVAVRVNPDIDPETHPYIATGLKKTKFGMAEKEAKKAYVFCQGKKWLNPVGISMHIGSQVEKVRPYYAAASKIIGLYKKLRKQSINLKYIDIGGGWAAHFERKNKLPHPDDYVSALYDLLKELPVTVIAEPGRSIIANAGILVTRVIDIKKSEIKRFCVVDAGMNDFIRPALYGAVHRIEPVGLKPGSKTTYDVVGPVCESSDFLGKGLRLPRVKRGDLLALFTAGAYGWSMSSNYNSRPRTAEIAVAGKRCFMIRRRETAADLLRGQSVKGIDRKLIEGLK